MKELLCTLFGHRARRFGRRDVTYGQVTGGYKDNIGREHWSLHMRCERCGQTFVAGRFHGPLSRWSS